jgi:hypothetical protein
MRARWPDEVQSGVQGFLDECAADLPARRYRLCEHCGTCSPSLIVHHPHRLAKVRQRELGPANVIASGQEQRVKLLCFACHQPPHAGGKTARRDRCVGGRVTGRPAAMMLA